MGSKLSKSYQNLDKDDIAIIFEYREKSLRLFFSDSNPNFSIVFGSYTKEEVKKELNYQLAEIDRDACLNLLASIEAVFRLDYAIRCEKKDKADISRSFRDLYAEYQHRISLEDGIFEEWKKVPDIKPITISFLKGAFK